MRLLSTSPNLHNLTKLSTLSIGIFSDEIDDADTPGEIHQKDFVRPKSAIASTAHSRSNVNNQNKSIRKSRPTSAYTFKSTTSNQHRHQVGSRRHQRRNIRPTSAFDLRQPIDLRNRKIQRPSTATAIPKYPGLKYF